MDAFAEFEKRLPQTRRTDLRGLTCPAAVQEYLDSLPYIAEDLDRSPLRVMADEQAHCLDGGIFAALALWRIGFRPLIVDMVPAPGSDDDHVLAVYRVERGWGALAKSNYPNLRSRAGPPQPARTGHDVLRVLFQPEEGKDPTGIHPAG